MRTSLSPDAIDHQMDALAEELTSHPDIVRVRWNHGEDSADNPCLFLRILVSDESSKDIERLKALAKWYRDRVFETPTGGLFTYTDYRTVSEQAKLKEKEWE